MLSKKPICNAPFANIYIDGKGNVTPCCFNRDDVFGNIYHDEIENIWNSSNAKAIRETLLNYKFPKGCQVCERALKYKNYYNSGIFTFSKLNYKKKEIQSIDFELSYWCNLSCIMCNLHTKKYELTNEQENELLKKISPLIVHLKKVRFYGGEPMLVPIYKKIWKLIIETNPRCNILLQTNGMILEPELIKHATKGNFTFNVSLDSLNAEKANKIRRGSQLNLILKNIEQMKKLTKNCVTLTVTPMTLNWEEIPNLVKFANKNSLQIFFNDLIQPKKLSLWALKAEELNKIRKSYQIKTFFPYTFIRLLNLIKFKSLINHIQSLKNEALKRPNYSQNDLDVYTQTVYHILIQKIPHFANLDKALLTQKIQSILFYHKIEEIVLFLQNTSVELIEYKVNEILNQE